VSWISLRIKPAANREGIIATLFNEGSQGVHEDGDMIVTHFPPETNVSNITAIIRSVDPGAEIAVGEAPPVLWDEWRANVDAHVVGTLTVTPPWLADRYDPATTIVIEPAMAFGTGEHPTTRGVLRLMQRVIKPGDVVADLGAGSAVLSIGAAKLGASRIVAIELDPDAVANAQENIARNGVESRVTYIEGDAAILLPLVAPVRVVLANIISSVLLELLPVIKRALSADGQVILSGILLEERDMVMSALQENGWSVDAEDAEEQWWSVLVTVAAEV
jgi:ribosomal protein L11 methyltransferase